MCNNRETAAFERRHMLAPRKGALPLRKKRVHSDNLTPDVEEDAMAPRPDRIPESLLILLFLAQGSRVLQRLYSVQCTRAACVADDEDGGGGPDIFTRQIIRHFPCYRSYHNECGVVSSSGTACDAFEYRYTLDVRPSTHCSMVSIPSSYKCADSCRCSARCFSSPAQ